MIGSKTKKTEMTISNMNYLKKLESRKWREKREEILKRDHFRCTCCGNEKNLIVHHTYYIAGFPNPWEYPNKSLLTLCNKCHTEFHEYHEIIIRKKTGKLKKEKKSKILSLAEIQNLRELRIRRRVV